MTKCRMCSGNLYTFLSLGKTPLANSFLRKEELQREEPTFPLDICFCTSCGFVQLDYTVPADKMFRNYIYFSSTSDLMQKHFAEFADKVTGMLKKGAFVVEIASNDGILLKNFKQKDIKVLGIEPAKNIAKYANDTGIRTINDYWSTRLAESVSKDMGKADAILANNVIAHIHDLHDFARGISKLLKDDGIVVIQVQYLIDFIERLEYDTIYHEHVSYISLHSVDRLFSQYGLSVFDVERFPDIHGGSIRFYLSKYRKQEKSVSDLLIYEKSRGFLSRSRYDRFALQVESHRTEIKGLLSGLKADGKRIAGYGAAAKANTMLNYCDIGPDVIDYIADKSKYKQGLFTPGTHIPGVSPEKIVVDKPDYGEIL
jgi:SAM-dependent methyltransferase